MAKRFFQSRFDLRCASDFRRRLSHYVDGELDFAAQERIAEHISECERCRQEYDALLFAKRAALNLSRASVVAPTWDAERAPAQAARRESAASALARIFGARISVPAPLFAIALLFVIACALVAARSMRRVDNGGANAFQTYPTYDSRESAAPPQTHETVRERIVTRTVYVARPREKRSSALRQGETAMRRENGALEGFRPIADARLRVVKESEQR